LLEVVANCDHICGLQTDTVSIVETQRMSGEMEAFTDGSTRDAHEESVAIGRQGAMGVRSEE